MRYIKTLLSNALFKLLTYLFLLTVRFLGLIRVISPDRMREILFNPKAFFGIDDSEQ
ncbi:MAG: hypothetical protein H6937_12160 [Burkholderiales bacterium]|nr:hypothetical protein [Burkholderiales bacterium]